MDDVFDSVVRSAGDFAGVFEFDGEVSYFYLYKMEGASGHKVIDSIYIFSGEPDFTEADISIRWSFKEQTVGLFIRKLLWAVFDIQQRSKYGGNYKLGASPTLPSEVVDEFTPTR